MKKVVKAELGKVGVAGDRFSSHSLRRGGAQLLNMRQASQGELQGMGGWKSETSMYEYLGTRIGAKFKAAERMANRYNLYILFCVCGGMGVCLGADLCGRCGEVSGAARWVLCFGVAELLHVTNKLLAKFIVAC